MARPERKTVDYFPHLIGDGKKIYLIEHKYGNDGYAVWFKLLESLASTADHFLDLSDPMDIMFMSAKCRVSEEVLRSILDDLSAIGEIDRQMWSIGIVWSEKFVESIADAYRKRSNKIQTLEGLRRLFVSNGRLKGAETPHNSAVKPQSKVKESKANQTEGYTASADSEESPPLPRFNMKKALIGEGVTPEAADQWLEVRKKKKATNTKIAFDAVMREINASGRSPDECIRFAVEMSWSGFKSIWMENELKKIPVNGTSTATSNNKPRTADDKRTDLIAREMAFLSGETECAGHQHPEDGGGAHVVG